MKFSNKGPGWSANSPKSWPHMTSNHHQVAGMPIDDRISIDLFPFMSFTSCGHPHQTTGLKHRWSMGQKLSWYILPEALTMEAARSARPHLRIPCRNICTMASVSKPASDGLASPYEAWKWWCFILAYTGFYWFILVLCWFTMVHTVHTDMYILINILIYTDLLRVCCLIIPLGMWLVNKLSNDHKWGDCYL